MFLLEFNEISFLNSMKVKTMSQKVVYFLLKFRWHLTLIHPLSGWVWALMKYEFDISFQKISSSYQ